MTDTMEYFTKRWEQKQPDAQISKQFWDSRAQEFNKKMDNNEGSIHLRKMISLLMSHGALCKNQNILDIGCGPGKYAASFAPFVHKVIALDISGNMIAYAQQNMKNKGLENVEFVQDFWETLELKSMGWERKFDLVFASMCPGIHSIDTLQKMIHASKKCCFMSGFIERKNTILDAIHRQLTGKALYNPHGEKMYCSFNILWELGYRPEICYIEKEWKEHWTIERLSAQYKLQANMLGIRERDDEYIIKCLKDFTQNSNLESITKAKIAWMIWEV